MRKTIMNSGVWMMLGATTILSAGSTGCSKFWTAEKSIKAKAEAAVEKPQAGPTKVLVDGAALALGQPEQGPEQQQKFLEKFTKLIQEERYAAARSWAEKHPDVCLEILRSTHPAVKDQPVLLTLATFHDEHCGIAEQARGWQACLTAQATQSEVVTAYHRQREAVLSHMRNGDFAAASKVDLVSAARRCQHPMREIDAWQLQGITLMLAEQGPASVEALEEAAFIAKTNSPYQCAHVLLMLSEARRRAGDHVTANQAWIDATTVGGNLLAREKPIADPTFWDRAMYLQPVGFAWPESLNNQLAGIGRYNLLPVCLAPVAPIAQCSFDQGVGSPVSVTISASIGFWRLHRGEAQPALLALKRAEAAGATPEVAAWCRLGQAKAMLAMDQVPAASAILMQQASNNNRHPATIAAMAELGSIKVRQGATLQGIALLKKALENNTEVDWPGRAAAEADLGLAYLLTADEKPGIEWLHRSRDRFRAQGDLEAVAQSIWNEARYFEDIKNKQQVAKLDAEHKSLQY